MLQRRPFHEFIIRDIYAYAVNYHKFQKPTYELCAKLIFESAIVHRTSLRTAVRKLL